MKSEDCASEQRGLRGLRRLAFSDRRFQPPGQVYDRNAPRLPDAKLRKWVKLIEARAARLERRGIQYVHLVIPEKLSAMITSCGNLSSTGSFLPPCGLARCSSIHNTGMSGSI